MHDNEQDEQPFWASQEWIGKHRRDPDPLWVLIALVLVVIAAALIGVWVT